MPVHTFKQKTQWVTADPSHRVASFLRAACTGPLLLHLEEMGGVKLHFRQRDPRQNNDASAVSHTLAGDQRCEEVFRHKPKKGLVMSALKSFVTQRTVDVSLLHSGCI